MPRKFSDKMLMIYLLLYELPCVEDLRVSMGHIRAKPLKTS